MQCREGAVLLSDSMGVLNTEAGEWPLPNRSKANWLKNARVATVVSGNAAHEVSGFSASIVSTDFKEAVTSLFEEADRLETTVASGFSSTRWADINPLDDVQLLAVGGTPGQRPRLARLTRKSRQWAGLLGEPTWYAVGGWVWSWLEPHGYLANPPPLTLRGCEEFALSLAQACLDESYGGRTFDELFAAGRYCNIGYPLYVVTFTADGRLEERRINENKATEVVSR